MGIGGGLDAGYTGCCGCWIQDMNYELCEPAYRQACLPTKAGQGLKIKDNFWDSPPAFHTDFVISAAPCDLCDTKASMKAVSQKSQRNARGIVLLFDP